LSQDYYEACKIRDLSSKASATLSRRVLQGMIRDFCGIKEKTLFHEIYKLETLSEEGKAPQGVTHETIEAMHHIRELGNIGAHMTEATNTIVDVDPDEAQMMIDLVEMLFADWYVARQQRTDKLAALKQAAAAKKPPNPG
jgi:hypothetical protein